MNRKMLLIIFPLFLLIGCATQRVPFPESELAARALLGDKTVSGKMFLIDQFEEEQVGKVSDVTLEPVTSYSEQWYEVNYLQNKALTTADPRYEKYLKRVKTDQEGRFSITGVAPGEYRLTGALFWEAMTCSINMAKTEVLISKRITVKASDEEVQVSLTKEYTSPTVVCDLYNQSEWQKDNWDL